jgi:hypothetical protein
MRRGGAAMLAATAKQRPALAAVAGMLRIRRISCSLCRIAGRTARHIAHRYASATAQHPSWLSLVGRSSSRRQGERRQKGAAATGRQAGRGRKGTDRVGACLRGAGATPFLVDFSAVADICGNGTDDGSSNEQPRVSRLAQQQHAADRGGDSAGRQQERTPLHPSLVCPYDSPV